MSRWQSVAAGKGELSWPLARMKVPMAPGVLMAWHLARGEMKMLGMPKGGPKLRYLLVGMAGRAGYGCVVLKWKVTPTYKEVSSRLRSRFKREEKRKWFAEFKAQTVRPQRVEWAELRAPEVAVEPDFNQLLKEMEATRS